MNFSDHLCDEVNTLNISERCTFVDTADDCKDDSHFPYMWFVYCGLGPEQSIGAVSICAIWLLFLFVALGVTADDFLCPSLIVITKTLHLSQNIAGVTFLAFGNGAPDIFSSLAGIEQARPHLVIGELFGAGIFVTTSVVGCICMTQSFKIMERPFLRDIIFYSCAAFWAYYLFYTKEIALRHAIGFIVLYIVYIIVVIVSRIVFKKCHEALSPPSSPKISVVAVEPEQSTSGNESQISNSTIPAVLLEHTSTLGMYDEQDDPENEGVVLRRFSYRRSLAIPRKRTLSQRRQSVMSVGRLSKSYEKENSKVSGEFLPPPLDSQISKTSLSTLISRGGKPGMLKLFFFHICPIDIEAWPEKPWYSRLTEICKAPIYFLLTLTTPMVDDDDDPEGSWNKAIAVFHCIVGPIFIAFASKRGLVMIVGVFPVAGIAACISIFLALVVMFTSKWEEPPKYYRMFGYLGFLVSVTWIYCLAKEIVALLKAVGILFGLSDAILGLTVLAWGNSIGDFISNISVARQGYPRMGISACFGGPLLNLLLGVGIPYTITLAKQEDHFMTLRYTSLISLLYGTLCLSLISTMLVMTAFKFQAKRCYGFFLIGLYVVFLTFAILLESKVFG